MIRRDCATYEFEGIMTCNECDYTRKEYFIANKDEVDYVIDITRCYKNCYGTMELTEILDN